MALPRTKIATWILGFCLWVVAVALAYLGLILAILGPMIGPRGDIDYVGFSDAAKQAADMQALIMQIFGVVILVISVGIFISGFLFVRRFYARQST
jgi:hypothetical protein